MPRSTTESKLCQNVNWKYEEKFLGIWNVTQAFYTYFTNGETETQEVICPRSQSYY